MKQLLAGAMLFVSSALMAQTTTLTLSSYSNANVVKYDGQTKDVTMHRHMFKGWNTVCLPVSLTAEEVTAAFGDDCKVEALKGVTANGTTYYLDFKSVGKIEANTPCIVYYNKEDGVVKIKATEATVEYQAEPKMDFSVGNATVSMVGATQVTDAAGLYGILAKDNAEAKFVAIDKADAAFLATRCYITATGVSNPTFIVTHNAQAKADKKANSRRYVNVAENTEDVIYNINGVLQAAPAKGINIVNGKKYAK